MTGAAIAAQPQSVASSRGRSSTPGKRSAIAPSGAMVRARASAAAGSASVALESHVDATIVPTIWPLAGFFVTAGSNQLAEARRTR